MDQVKFVQDSLWKIWSDMVCLGRPYHLKFFNSCLPQILLGPLLNILSHLMRLVFNINIYIQLCNIPNLDYIAKKKKKIPDCKSQNEVKYSKCRKLNETVENESRTKHLHEKIIS